MTDRVPASPPATGKEPVNGLKPCPFCGRDAELRVVGHRVREWIVRCPAEHGDRPCPIAPMSRHQPTEVDAIAAWNQRVPASPRENRGWGCGCVPDFEHTACPLHAKSDVYLIPAPVASGTPKCLSYRAGHGLCDVCSIGGDCSALSPAAAAPGVDFEKAMDELGSVVWAFHAKEHKADFRALVTRIREGHRALVDAAVAQARWEEREKAWKEIAKRFSGPREAPHAE